MVLDKIIDHIRNRPYMSGIERDAARIKLTEECFTPTNLCKEIVLDYENNDLDLFSNPHKNFLDPSCGDGQFLGEVLIRKVENGIPFEQALQTIYGVDLMPDNVELCRERLLCGQEHLRHIVERNIVCADALRYHYRFDGSDPYETKQDQHFNSLFSIEG